MRHGLVLGKFMPLHNGHLGLINFAARHCDTLTVLLCAEKKEIIPGHVRLQWLKKEIAGNSIIELFEYSDEELPNTSVSSIEVSSKWSAVLKERYPFVNIIFASEQYGNFLAALMNISCMLYDEKRIRFPVSASQISEHPFAYWEHIPASVKNYYTKKVFIVGTESTGKSILTEKLAMHYNTVFVPEMARDIIEHTEECTYDDLAKIAAYHANKIINMFPLADKLLFIDTDINITRSYAAFLFNKELLVPGWVEEANKGDLYIFLEPDCPLVQDGTRLDEDNRNKLSRSHENMLNKNNISYIRICGDWDSRLKKAIEIIEENCF